MTELQFVQASFTLGFVNSFLQYNMDVVTKGILARFSNKIRSVLGTNFETRMAEFASQKLSRHSYYGDCLADIGCDTGFAGGMTQHVLQNMTSMIWAYHMPLYAEYLTRNEGPVRQFLMSIAVVATRQAMRESSDLDLFVRSVIAATEKHGRNFNDQSDSYLERQLRDLLLADVLEYATFAY